MPYQIFRCCWPGSEGNVMKLSRNVHVFERPTVHKVMVHNLWIVNLLDTSVEQKLCWKLRRNLETENHLFC